MSGFLFNIINWVMRNTISAKRVLGWKLTMVLEDLAYADDMVLLSSQKKDLQEKCSCFHQVSRYIGLCINTTQTKVQQTLYLCRCHYSLSWWVSYAGYQLQEEHKIMQLSILSEGLTHIAKTPSSNASSVM